MLIENPEVRLLTYTKLSISIYCTRVNPKIRGICPLKIFTVTPTVVVPLGTVTNSAQLLRRRRWQVGVTVKYYFNGKLPRIFGLTFVSLNRSAGKF
jgi:hypothetical protein